MTPWKLWILVLFLPLVVFQSGGIPAAAAVAEPSLQQLQESFNRAIARVRPSVVSVKAQKKMAPGDAGGNGGIWYESIGSGFVVDARGYILTNYHVVENAETILVTLWHARPNVFSATVTAADQSLDLVVLKIEADGPLTAAPLADSSRLETGDWVISIGSPFGFKHSATLGIVSDLNREMAIGGVSYKDMIQTDALINQGNSGGPLIDIDGMVVGVGTAIYAPKGVYAGLGFAIRHKPGSAFYSQVAGVVLAAMTAPGAAPNNAGAKEPVNLNNKMPGDAIHSKFTDCTQCHTITQKLVASYKAKMPHPAVGACDTCHIMVNDKVAAGPVTVAAVQPMSGGTFDHLSFGSLFESIILKLVLITLVSSIIFTMLGVGGGFAFVPILLSCGVDFHTAASTSLVMLTAASISALYTYFKSGLVDLRLCAVLEPPTMVGAFAGGMMAHYFNASLLSVMFACILFVSSYFMLQEKAGLEVGGRQIHISPWEWNNSFAGYTYRIDLMLATPLTFVVGYMGGLLGVAGGWLKVPIMVVLFGVPMKVAVATSSLMVPITGFAGSLGHSFAGHFDPRLAISLSVVTVIGAQIGSRLSILVDSNLLRFIFAFVLSVVGLWMIIRVF